jgi:hypothetical protein
MIPEGMDTPYMGAWMKPTSLVAVQLYAYDSDGFAKLYLVHMLLDY